MSTNQFQGALQPNDLLYPQEDGYFNLEPDKERYYDDVSLTGLTVGQQVTITLESQQFTPQLELRSGIGKRQKLGVQTTFTVEAGRDYILSITSQNPREFGEYTLTASADILNPLQPYQSEALLQRGQYRWPGSLGQPVTLTYSFMEKLPSYYTENRKGEWDDDGKTGNFKPLTQAQREAIELALQEWEKVSGITFKPVSDRNSVQLRFGTARPSDASFGWARYPTSGRLIGGDMWLNNKEPSNRNPVPGSYGFSTILHEIGHTLGLSHPFDQVITLPKLQSNVQYTSMAYDNFPGLPSRFQPRTPMLYDIAAIQQLYGKNSKTGRGDTVYRWKPGETFIETIYDTGGTDIISVRNQKQNAVVNLESGKFSSIGDFRGRLLKNNVAIAFGVTIENAIGGVGNDILIGNEKTNRLLGNSGADVITGLAGNDRLTGGAGSDTFVFQTENDGVDRITDFAQGNDTIDVSLLLNQISYTGTDPLLEGIITASIQQGNTVISFDRDGFGGVESAAPLAILENFTDMQNRNSAMKFVM